MVDDIVNVILYGTIADKCTARIVRKIDCNDCLTVVEVDIAIVCETS